MKKVILVIKMPDYFEIGKCSECKFAKGSDQCKLTELLTDGNCSLNCFCPLGLGSHVINE